MYDCGAVVVTAVAVGRWRVRVRSWRVCDFGVTGATAVAGSSVVAGTTAMVGTFAMAGTTATADATNSPHATNSIKQISFSLHSPLYN